MTCHEPSLPASDLAADQGCPFTIWADACHAPTPAGVTGGWDMPAATIPANVSL